MKKLLLLIVIAASGIALKAQDTLIWNNFETDPFVNMQVAVPPGFSTDTSWYTYDLDQNGDGSGQNRPSEWYWSAPFAPGDTLTGNTGVMASNSWSNSNIPNENILVTPSVYIGDGTAVLSWKSAPYQTPRYLDGYQILIGIGNNDLGTFTDTIFKGSEYVSLDNATFPADFSSYTFLPGPTANPLNPFVHGMDSTYTELDPTSDSSRLRGRLRPFTYSLSAYTGQTIFIMFRHYCTDDNLLSLDDILVTGTDFSGIQQVNSGIAFSAYPNPAKDELNISYTLSSSSSVVLNVYDIEGKLVSSENKGTLSGTQTNRMDVSALPAGMYRVELVTEMGRSNQKVVVQ